MPKSEPKTPASAPKEQSSPKKPAAQCPTDKALTITSETVETDIADRARKKIGVGEAVLLTAKPGPAEWKIENGGGQLSTDSGESTTFTAPEREVEVLTISAQANGCQASITFEVVAPSGVMMELTSVLPHGHGAISAGMTTAIWLLPAGVSFRAVRIREEEVNATSWGYYQANPPHHPNPNPWAIEGVDAKGTKLAGGDKCTTSLNSVGEGGLQWAIPWAYTVGNDIFDYHLPSPVLQVAEVKNGVLTLSKAGASVKSTDPVS